METKKNYLLTTHITLNDKTVLEVGTILENVRLYDREENGQEFRFFTKHSNKEIACFFLPNVIEDTDENRFKLEQYKTIIEESNKLSDKLMKLRNELQIIKQKDFPITTN